MREAVRVVLEGLAVSVAGLGIGLAANAMSPKGLKVSKNYFPKLALAHPVGQPKATMPSGTQDPLHPEASASAHASQEPQVSPANPSADSTQVDPVHQHLHEIGLNTLPHEEVAQMHSDPRTQVNAFLFIDARDDAHYQAGHIPGAYQLDHYYIDRYIDQVLPLAMNAEKVVVYCNGGECEDSEFAAIELRNRGLDPSRLFVYPGGLEAWRQHGLAVERGARGSGDLNGGAQ